MIASSLIAGSIQMPNLIIFAEPQIGFAPALLDSFLTALGTRRPYDRVRVCVTSPDKPLWMHRARFAAGYAVKALFNRNMRNRLFPGSLDTVTTVARKHGVELIEPPGYDVNGADFIRSIEQDTTQTDALCLGCLQIWSPALLDCFRRAVNYHNGYLPDYKGLWATRWSLYRGEAYSGYAFHLMDASIDTGPILLRGRVPIPPDGDPTPVEHGKIAAACGDAGNLLDAMLAEPLDQALKNDGGSYFSLKDTVALRRIDDPSAITAAEFDRRLRYFPPLNVAVKGATVPVTATRPSGSANTSLSFVTADGVAREVTRLNYLPVWLFRLTRALGLQKRQLSP